MNLIPQGEEDVFWGGVLREIDLNSYLTDLYSCSHHIKKVNVQNHIEAQDVLNKICVIYKSEMLKLKSFVLEFQVVEEHKYNALFPSLSISEYE